jgi:hypothetical protein
MERSDIKSIESGQGLGVLKFGLTREEVKAILGQADEKETFSMGEEDESLTEGWHYDDLDLSLAFDEEDDWRLGTIAVSSDDFQFMGFSPVGLSKDQLADTLSEKGINDLIFEDLSSVELPAHHLLSSEFLGMNFWFDSDLLTEVQWGPLFNSNDEIIWP